MKKEEETNHAIDVIASILEALVDLVVGIFSSVE